MNRSEKADHDDLAFLDDVSLIRKNALLVHGNGRRMHERDDSRGLLRI
jgi:hypothetical protein